MLKLSNFLKLENFVIFKEKCLANGSPKVWDFIASTEVIFLDKTLTIEQQVRNILGYVVSDLSILDFLLTNIFEYDEETAMSIKFFMEEDVDSEDKQQIFEKLVKQGIESMTISQYENDAKVYETILSDLVAGDEDHLIKDDVVYFVQGDFLICYNSKLGGFNFEFFGKEYKEIAELLNLEKTPTVDKEYTELLFQSFTFDGDWLEDIYGLTEAHYNEFGEEHEHSNIYGDVEKKIVYWDNEGTFFESVFERFGHIIRAGFDLMNTTFYGEESTEEEEEAFSKNYPFPISFDDYLNELQHNFNGIYLNYIQKCNSKYEIEKYDRVVDTINKIRSVDDNITLSKENFITALENFKNVMDIVGYKDVQNLADKYFTFKDTILGDDFDTNRFVELLKSVDYNQNEDLSVWKDSYLTLE